MFFVCLFFVVVVVSCVCVFVVVVVVFGGNTFTGRFLLKNGLNHDIDF